MNLGITVGAGKGSAREVDGLLCVAEGQFRGEVEMVGWRLSHRNSTGSGGASMLTSLACCAYCDHVSAPLLFSSLMIFFFQTYVQADASYRSDLLLRQRRQQPSYFLNLLRELARLQGRAAAEDAHFDLFSLASGSSHIEVGVDGLSDQHGVGVAGGYKAD